MKWQFLPLVIVLVAAVLLVWRSSGKKSSGCGCKGRCSHAPDSEAARDHAQR